MTEHDDRRLASSDNPARAGAIPSRDEASAGADKWMRNAAARVPFLWGALLGVLGIAFLIAGHYLGEAGTWFGPPLEKIGEFMLLVVSLHFIYEVFAKRSEHALFRQDLNDAIEGDRERWGDIASNLQSVVAHTRSTLNIVNYLDPEVFKEKWLSFARKHSTIIIVGSFPVEILHIIEQRKNDPTLSVRIYSCLGPMSSSLIKRILRVCETVSPASVRLYHVERLDIGGIIFGTDFTAVTVEALMDFSTSQGEQPIGYHVFGQAAIVLLTSIRSQLTPPESPGLPGNTTSPVRIASEFAASFLKEHRETYCQIINTLYEGVPIGGESTICERMSQMLARARSHLDVTHIAKNKASIDIMAGEAFQAWLQLNYAAASGLGRPKIRVRRLFLIGRQYKDEPALLKAMNQMSDSAIEVYFLCLDEIGSAFHEDFSLYDDCDVMFVRHQGRSGWVSESEARHSRDSTTVLAFRRIFDTLMERATRVHTNKQASQPLLFPLSPAESRAGGTCTSTIPSD